MSDKASVVRRSSTAGRPSPEERFLRRITVNDRGCWIWSGSNLDGYGYFWVSGKCVRVTRWAYEHWIGAIPPGLVLDHYACDNGGGGCSNPWHCRPVTNAENSARNAHSRKTHCANGHEYTPENTYKHGSDGSNRRCRRCVLDSNERWRLKKIGRLA